MTSTRTARSCRSTARVIIAVGFVVAFVAALFVVRRLVNFVSRHGFGVFAWYRIALGVVALLALAVFR